MFEKLLANLPYNPSLIHQMRFYSKRLRQEQALRRLGLVFVVLAFFVQFFAVASPPQSTSAESTNDLVNGGISSAANAARVCRDNTAHYGDILDNYGISCSDVAKATTVSIKSTDHDRKLYSMGRKPYGLKGETPVTIKGNKYYFRYLWSWDTAGASSYTALKFTSGGDTFYILYGCGNLVSIGLPKASKPPAPAPKPQPKDVCDNVPGVQTKKSQCDVCDNKPGVQTKDSDCDVCDNIPGIQMKESQCDVCTDKSGVQTKDSQCDLCSNLAGVQTKSSQCDVCSNVPGVQMNSSECDVCLNQPGVQVNQAQCDLCPDQSGIQTSYDQCDVCPTMPGVQTDSSQCNTCQYDSSLSADDSACVPCAEAQSSEDTAACVEVSKTASNTTQGLSDANNTTAQAGDVIVYNLYAKNTGKVAVNDYPFQEDLSDVLDYADVVDLHGGSIDNNGIVSWPSPDIAAGQTVTEQITVKVKDQIPQTPVDPNDPGHYDHVITNVYGNTININLPGTMITTVSQTTTSLPNTGPGTSLMIGGAIALIAGYFFARTRLLAEESVIAIQETTNGGM